MHHPVSASSTLPREFNHTLGADSLEVKDLQGNRYTVLNLVDMGTCFQQAIVLGEGGGDPSAQSVLEGMQQHWISWAGHPHTFIADRGTSFRGEVTQYLAQHGTNILTAPLETRQGTGRVERHGGLLKVPK